MDVWVALCMDCMYDGDMPDVREPRRIVSMRFSEEEIRLLDALVAVHFERHRQPVSRTAVVRSLMTRVPPSDQPSPVHAEHRLALQAVRNNP